ncbi:3'-5' exonuclease [Paenibacillus sp. V4I7]|uniref:3'-5' exonuclease n=1 Tax=Paenibacillus sp. V4I7 TaxID=3042307 RepID=UPI002785DC54|nr:3'-5' exonuclease [Paenibacillus sp. V4I7]MDQ0899100.1 inhibitor of KinA sporulation pathway (predicted exonuclease) [Paenibacillus sp. V4I7]
MHYIVMDMEFNGRRHYDIYPMETIEIGAVKLNEQLEIVDTFQSFIRPKFPLNRFALQFCGITEETLLKSKPFEVVIEKFKKFCGSDFKLIAWGGSDFFTLLVDCKVNRIKNEWVTTHLLDMTRFFEGGLQQALEDHGLHFIGQSHSALDDALNAVHLLMLKPGLVNDTNYFIPDPFKICTGGIKKWIQISLDEALQNNRMLRWDDFLRDQNTQKYISIMNLTDNEIGMVQKLFNKFAQMKYGSKFHFIRSNSAIS